MYFGSYQWCSIERGKMLRLYTRRVWYHAYSGREHVEGRIEIERERGGVTKMFRFADKGVTQKNVCGWCLSSRHVSLFQPASIVVCPLLIPGSPVLWFDAGDLWAVLPFKSFLTCDVFVLSSPTFSPSPTLSSPSFPGRSLHSLEISLVHVDTTLEWRLR